MRRFVAGFLCGFFLLAAFAWLDGRLARVKINSLEASLRDATAKVSSWQARYAEASTSVQVRTDTVRVALTRYRTVRDSVVATDTVRVREVLRVADSVADSCQLLVTTCTAFRLAADSTISAFEQQQRASNFYIDGLQREVASERARVKRGKVLTAGAFVGGALLGAWVRGQ